MIQDVVIPAAGYGTRVSPASRAVPKELFPIPIVAWDGNTYLIPALQIIIENLFGAGFRRFYIVVNKYKEEVIKGFLEPDYSYLKTLYRSGKNVEANLLNEFYRILENIDVVYVMQEEALGVGDAVYRCKELIANDFMIHMGDDFIVGPVNQYKLLVENYLRLKADALVMVKKVDDPRQYGIVEGIDKGRYIEVKEIIEKPETTSPKYAILGIYCIKPAIFQVMEELNKSGEWELTDAVQAMIDKDYKVYALKIDEEGRRVDIGRVETYLELMNNPIRKYI